jgi:transglutaminase-like putative cysteine protease
VEIRSQYVPGTYSIARDAIYGNRIMHILARPDSAGNIPVSITYLVTRREAGEHEDYQPLGRFLQPDRKVPIDGKPLELLRDRAIPDDSIATAKMLYDLVNRHMRYSKDGVGWGEGDATWACESRFGNCTDFHSLFISLVRSRKIPAKFEIGFPLPDNRGEGAIAGYHCWAWFRPEGRGWIPVDISEANKNPMLRGYYFGRLTENRIALSAGRDIDLVPKQQGPPLNFFVYPYVEVNGKPQPPSKIVGQYTFKDVME